MANSILKLFLSRHISRLSLLFTPACYISDATRNSLNISRNSEFRQQLNDGPTLQDFILNQNNRSSSHILKYNADGNGKKVYFETYGCQMNVNDTEIAWSILHNNGYERCMDIKKSNIVLIMTCSIREGAETKIWKRLEYFKHLKKLKFKAKESFQICLLGCMAERLKSKLLHHVDVICGPDAYMDLPKLLLTSKMMDAAAMNVALSLEETYADVTPLRLNESSVSAFVSIMRGCDNMCTYCIVPFTRGRERSRPIDSILNEVEQLSEQGVKEVTLLGQNVNSYRDLSSKTNADISRLSEGFKTVYKPKLGGKRFTELISIIANKVPNMRIRFTSPHPKDFPNELLYAINEYPNICKQIHLPAQSGSSKVLEYMKRGYTRDSYLKLVDHIKDIIPNVSLSSDFIAGFCGETDSDHTDTLTLMQYVKYNFAFCFPYSMREKTKAFHRLKDDVLYEKKSERHMELINQFRNDALEINKKFIGNEHIILIECDSKRSKDFWVGRNDQNIKVIFSKGMVNDFNNKIRSMETGDFVKVKICSATSQTLKGDAIEIVNSF